MISVADTLSSEMQQYYAQLRHQLQEERERIAPLFDDDPVDWTHLERSFPVLAEPMDPGPEPCPDDAPEMMPF